MFLALGHTNSEHKRWLNLNGAVRIILQIFHQIKRWQETYRPDTVMNTNRQKEKCRCQPQVKDQTRISLPVTLPASLFLSPYSLSLPHFSSLPHTLSLPLSLSLFDALLFSHFLHQAQENVLSCT